MDNWGERLLDWLKSTFHSKFEPPVDVDESEDGLALQQGPYRTRLRYVARIVGEALVYGLVLAGLLFLTMLFGRSHGGSTPSIMDRLTIGYYFAVTAGPACSATVFPVLLMIRRGELEWSRLVITEGAIHLTKGKWFGPRSVLELDASDVAAQDAHIECTPHLDIAEERDVLDLTIDSDEHFETFAVGLPPDTARDFAERANQLLDHG
jgi:hypothetical protein